MDTDALCARLEAMAWHHTRLSLGYGDGKALNAADLHAAIAAIRRLEADRDRARDIWLDAAAKVAEHRHKAWRMPHPDDALPDEVCCDVTACADIARAIHALAPAPPEPAADQGDA